MIDLLFKHLGEGRRRGPKPIHYSSCPQHPERVQSPQRTHRKNITQKPSKANPLKVNREEKHNQATGTPPRRRRMSPLSLRPGPTCQRLRRRRAGQGTVFGVDVLVCVHVLLSVFLSSSTCLSASTSLAMPVGTPENHYTRY
jgi:hypothetical protein